VGVRQQQRNCPSAAELTSLAGPLKAGPAEALLALPPLQNLKIQRVLLARGGEASATYCGNTLRLSGGALK